MASRDFARPGRTRYVFLDTNALLDLCDKDRPGHDAMRQLARRSISHRDVELHASISSFKDLYYILSRLYKDEHRARLAVEKMMGPLVAPVVLLASFGQTALACDEPDFEDALIRISAEREGADVLLTRDSAAFLGSSVAKKSPAELVGELSA